MVLETHAICPTRLTTSMHRQRASMGCRHSAPVDPIDAPTDAIRPKLLPPSRHGSVIPTARDPLASIGQQSKLPRRSSLSSVGRLGRAAGAPQSRTEFDAALTAKLERLALSRGTEGSGEADASEAVVEVATPDRGVKSQQNAHPRRGVVGVATDRDAVADWARRADAYLESRSGGAVVEGYGRTRLNAGETGWVPAGGWAGEQEQEQERRRRLRKPPIDADVPFSRTRTRAASLGRRDPIEPVPVSRRAATRESRVSSSSASASTAAPTYTKPTIASRHAAASDSDPIVVTKHFVWDPERGLRRRAECGVTNGATHGVTRGATSSSGRTSTPPTPPTIAPTKLRADSPRRVVAPMSSKMLCLRAKLSALRIPGEETERRPTHVKRNGAATQHRLRPSSHLYPTY